MKILTDALAIFLIWIFLFVTIFTPYIIKEIKGKDNDNHRSNNNR